MSLAARCPACGTVFRVVQDQLRVSEGWVRCGRCAEVFNAIESLVDLDADAATRPVGRPQRSERVLEDLARVGSGVDIEVAAAPPATAAETPAAFEEEALGPQPPAADEPGLDDDDQPAPPGATAGAAVAPGFVKQAERAARWRHPAVRASLVLVGLASAIALAGQAVIEYRDWVGVQWPATRPWLEQACAPLGCHVGAPRAIDGLAVESSGLVRVEGSPNYRLSVVLRNRTPFAVATPSIDLTLTDSQGAVIARRVLSTGELGATQTSLAARSDLSMQVTLAATERAVSGYTIEIFYP